MFTVGSFARVAGVSAKVLRAFDAEGLFRPAWVEPSSGYRYYSPAQLPALRRILALRDVGLSRAEIADLVIGGTDLHAVLERRRRELEEERRELDRRLAALEIRISADAARADVVVRILNPELVACLREELVGGDLAAGFHELESHVRDQGVRASRPPGAIPDEDVIFVPIRRTIPETERIVVRRLPVTRAATILHHGDYGSLPRARGDLIAWVQAAGLSAAGPLRILYLQFGTDAELRVPRPWTVDRDEDFVTELQLPIGDGVPARP